MVISDDEMPRFRPEFRALRQPLAAIPFRKADFLRSVNMAELTDGIEVVTDEEMLGHRLSARAEDRPLVSPYSPSRHRRGWVSGRLLER